MCKLNAITATIIRMKQRYSRFALALFCLGVFGQAEATTESYKPLSFYELPLFLDSPAKAEKIRLYGWLGTYGNKGERRVYLFPSKESMAYYQVLDTLCIEVSESQFQDLKAEYNGEFISVTGAIAKPQSEAQCSGIAVMAKADYFWQPPSRK